MFFPFIKDVILPNLPRDPSNINNPNARSNESPPFRVGCVTYDKELHFYNLKNILAPPQLVMMPNLNGFLVK